MQNKGNNNNKMDEIKSDYQQHQQDLYVDHLLTEGLAMHGKSSSYEGEYLPLPSLANNIGKNSVLSIHSPQQICSPNHGTALTSMTVTPGSGGGAVGSSNIVDAMHSHEEEIDGNIQHLVGGLLFEHIKHYPQRENLLRTPSGGGVAGGNVVNGSGGTGPAGTGGTNTPTVSNLTYSNPGSRNSSRPSTPTGIMIRPRPASLVMSGFVQGSNSNGNSNSNSALPSPSPPRHSGNNNNNNNGYFYNIGNHPTSGNLNGISQLTANEAFPNTSFFPVGSPNCNNNGPGSAGRNSSGNGSGGRRGAISPDVSEVTLFTEAKQSAENSPTCSRDNLMNRKSFVSPSRAHPYPTSGGGGGGNNHNSSSNQARRSGSAPVKRTTTPTTSRYAAGNAANGANVGGGVNGQSRFPSPTRINSSPTKVGGRTSTPTGVTSTRPQLQQLSNQKQSFSSPVPRNSSPNIPNAKRSVNPKVTPRLVSPERFLSPSAKRAAMKAVINSPTPTKGRNSSSGTANKPSTPSISKRNILNSAVGGRDLSFGRNGSMLGPFNLMTRELTDEQYKKFNQADLETLHRQLKLLKLQLKSKISCDRVENESMIKKLWLLVTTQEDEAYTANIQERTMEEFIRVHQRLLDIDEAMGKVLESVAPTFERLNLFNRLKILQKDAQNQVKSIKQFNVRAKLNQDYAEKILNLEKAVKLLERMNEKRERLFITKIKDEATRLNAVAGLTPPPGGSGSFASRSSGGLGGGINGSFRSGASSGRSSPSLSVNGGGGGAGSGNTPGIAVTLSHSLSFSERKQLMEERRREAISKSGTLDDLTNSVDEDFLSDKVSTDLGLSFDLDGNVDEDNNNNNDAPPSRFMPSREPSSDTLYEAGVLNGTGRSGSLELSIDTSGNHSGTNSSKQMSGLQSPSHQNSQNGASSTVSAPSPRLSPPNLPSLLVTNSPFLKGNVTGSGTVVASSPRTSSPGILPPTTNSSIAGSASPSAVGSTASSPRSGKWIGSPKHYTSNSNKLSPHPSQSNMPVNSPQQTNQDEVAGNISIGDVNVEVGGERENFDSSLAVSAESNEVGVVSVPAIMDKEEAGNVDNNDSFKSNPSDKVSRPSSISKQSTSGGDQNGEVKDNIADPVDIALEVSGDSDIIGLIPSNREEKSDDSSTDNSDGEGEEGERDVGEYYGTNMVPRLEVIEEGDEEGDEDDDTKQKRISLTKEGEKGDGGAENNEDENDNEVFDEEEKEDAASIGRHSRSSRGSRTSTNRQFTTTRSMDGLGRLKNESGSGSGKHTPQSMSGSSSAKNQSFAPPTVTDSVNDPPTTTTNHVPSSPSHSPMKDNCSERSEDDTTSEIGGISGAISIASDGTSQSNHLQQQKKKKRRPTLKGLVKRTKSLFGRPLSSSNLHETAAAVDDVNNSNHNGSSNGISSPSKEHHNTSFMSPTKQNIQALKSVPSSQLMSFAAAGNNNATNTSPSTPPPPSSSGNSGINQGTAWDDDLGIRHVDAKDFDLQSISSANTSNTDNTNNNKRSSSHNHLSNQRPNSMNPAGIAAMNSHSTDDYSTNLSAASGAHNAPPMKKKKSLSFYGVAKGVASFFKAKDKHKDKDSSVDDNSGMDTSVTEGGISSGGVGVDVEKMEKSSVVSGVSNNESDPPALKKSLSKGRLSFFGKIK